MGERAADGLRQFHVEVIVGKNRIQTQRVAAVVADSNETIEHDAVGQSVHRLLRPAHDLAYPRHAVRHCDGQILKLVAPVVVFGAQKVTFELLGPLTYHQIPRFSAFLGQIIDLHAFKIRNLHQNATAFALLLG